MCPLNLWRKRASIYVVARWQGMLAVRVIPRRQPVSLGASLFDRFARIQLTSPGNIVDREHIGQLLAGHQAFSPTIEWEG